MPDMNQKLDRFTATILAEATAETARTMEEIKVRRDAAYAEAEDKVLLEAYKYIHTEVAAIKTESGRRVSRHMLESKGALYLRREEIAKEVLGLVRQKIAAFTQTEAYGQRLLSLYHEALDTLPGADDVRVYLRPADRGYAPALTKAAPQVRAVFLDGSFALGGLIAESPALGLRADSSFDSAAEALSGHFAELFGLSLSDDE